MKNRLTKGLVLSALAIGMSSTVMAGEHSKTEKLCDLSTLKGLYHFSINNHTSAMAGEMVFDGQGGGVINGTLKLLSAANLPDNQSVKLPFSYEQDIGGECAFTLHNMSATNPFQETAAIYAQVSGDAASIVKNQRGEAVAFEVTRGPSSSTHE